MTNEQPEQWAVELLGDLVGLWAAFGEASAVEHLQRAFAEREAELVGENAKLREDALRYRWLRDHSCPPHQFYLSVPVEFKDDRYTPSDVDAYIDAALAAYRGEA